MRYPYVRVAKDAPNRMTQSFFPSRVPFQSYEPIYTRSHNGTERFPVCARPGGARALTLTFEPSRVFTVATGTPYHSHDKTSL